DLARLYQGLAHRGVVRSLKTVHGGATRPLGRIASEDAAARVLDILAETALPPGHARLRSSDGGRRVAYKTGTSYGFRDSWAIGVDADHTVGVWVGRADGRPHQGAYGATAAAPLMLDIFATLPTPSQDVAAAAFERRMREGRELPERLQRFVSRGQRDPRAGPAIVFPDDGATIVQAGRRKDLVARAVHGAPPYRWTVNGTPAAGGGEGSLQLPQLSLGQQSVELVDAAGRRAASSFWYEPAAADKSTIDHARPTPE
ncbi:MAG: hypothetical protein AAGF49_11745, partial [Pseudomonadota bacterium]